jgi:gliding motility-associated-like protein
MKLRLLSLFLFFVTCLWSRVEAQTCPTAAASIIEVCNDSGGSGTIRVYFTNGDAPSSYVLYTSPDFQIASAPIGPALINTSIPLPPGTIAGVEFTNVPDGDYIVRANLPGHTCPPLNTNYIIIGGLGINVNSANALSFSGLTIDPDCNPLTGGGNADGSISITINGGVAPYTVSWSSTATNIPGSTVNTSPGNISVSSLDGGMYTLTVVDGNNCTISQDIDVPIATIPDAGPDQSLCNVTSTTLAANAVGASEVGKWTVVSGSGIFANDTSPTTTVSGLTIGSSSTFEWTITDNNTPALCPGNADQVTISVGTPPTTAAAGPDQTLCATSTTLAANTPAVGTGAWTIESGAGGSITTPSSPTSGFTGIQGTTYVLKWAISNGSCTPSEDLVTITMDANPTLAAAGPDQIVCATTTALAANTPSIGTGSWTIVSGTGGSVISPSNPNSTFTGTAGQSYVLRWTISNATCPSSQDDVSIQFDQSPTNPNAGPNQNLCANTTTLAANTITIGTGAWSIVSGVGGSFGNVNSPTSSFTGVQGTTYLLRWSSTNGTCPVETDDVQIRFAAPPTTANAGGDQTLCGASTSLAGNTPVIGTGTWSIISGSGGSIVTPSSPTSVFNGVAGTTYVLRWRITNNPCTASSDNVQITFEATPTTANAGADQTICATSTTLAGNTPVTGTGAWTIISGTGGSFSNSASATATFTGTAGQTYVLQWTISNGTCPSSSDLVQIIMQQAPSASNAGADQTLCGVTTTLAANNPAVGTGAWTIQSGTGGSFGNATSPTSSFSGNAGQTYTLRWTISNGVCTAQTDDVVITFDAPPTTAAAGGNQTICGTSTTLAGNSPVTGTGLWTIVSGTGGSVTAPGNPTSAFTGTAGQTYILEWTISNGSCAASSDQVQIQLFAAPSAASAGPDQTLCNVTSATLAANTPAVGTGMWSIVSGAGGNVVTPASPTSTFTGTLGTSYTLQWTITNGACASTQEQVVITFNEPPTTPDAGDDQQVCGTSTTLDGNSPIVGSGTWAIISGVGGAIESPSSPTSNFTGVIGETYILEWSISNGTCPDVSDPVQVEMFGAPTVANAGPDQVLCNTTTTLAANAPTTGIGLWSIESGAGGLVASPNDPASPFTGVAGEVYTLRWTISNGPCTPSQSEVTITVGSATTSSAGADQTDCSPITLDANSPGVGETGVWGIRSGAGGTFGNASLPNTTFTGSPGVVYVLEWTISSVACSSTDEVTIEILPPPTIANAGVDQNVCGSAALNANNPSVGTGMWAIFSGAGGTFIDPTSATTTFNGVPGESYQLTWTITSGSCVSQDNVNISISASSPPMANAGLDQDLCGTSTFLNGSDPGASANGTWSIISGSGGNFGNINVSNSTFDGVAGQTYELQWTIANNVAGCDPSFDWVEITFSDLPTLADAGTIGPVCGTSTNLTGNTPTSGSGIWTIDAGVGGTVQTPSNPTSLFSGLTSESYTLTWTISNACGSSSSSVDVSFVPLTTANAGADIADCATEVTLGANAPTDGIGMWSIISGVGGTIDVPSNPSSTFSGVSGEVYTLRWTIENGTCSSQDDMTVTINPETATPDAGPDQELCSDLTTLQGVGSGTWSLVSGSGGSIGNAGVPNSSFSGVRGTTYVLSWTVNGSCGPASDEVTITFDEEPTTADAGTSPLQPCGPTTLSANTPTIGTGLWTIVSGTGGVLGDVTSPNSTFSGVGGATYILEWTISNGSCTPSTSQVQVEVDANSPTIANAGADQPVCGTSTTLNGNDPVVGTGQWSIISGVGGSFTDLVSNPSTGFTGVTGETYVLRWTISSGVAGCTDSSDEVTITFDDALPVANAGSDQAVCGPVASVNASASTPATGTWSVVSGFGGSFTDPASAITDFNGIPGNIYVLEYTITSACGNVSDQVTVTLDDNPTDAFAGLNKTICGTEPLEAEPVFIGTGAWSVISGAGGVFTDDTDPNSGFTGTAGTIYTLRWTTSNGSCDDKTADVVITVDINSPSIANAGPDQALCSTSTTLAANTPTSGNGMWSVLTGTGGTFTPDAFAPDASFTGIAGSTYILRWSITAAGCANPTVDDMRVQFEDVPSVANAGPDQQDCTTTYALAANTPTSGTGTWTITAGAGGSFLNENNPTTTFTGVSGEIYTLVWTIENTCGSSVDNLTITINGAPTTANAGPDQVICGSVFATLSANAPVSGTGTWSIVSGTGGSFVSNTNPTTQFIGTTGVSYTLRWIIANGLCTPSFDDVTINFAASPVVTTPVTVCQNTVAGPLTAVAPGATSFEWYYYTNPSDPLTRTLLPTTTASHTPGVELNTAVVGSLTYEVVAVYSCGDSPASQIVVNVSNTGSCGSSGGNCPALTSIPITPTLTTCADPDSGALLFTLPGSYDVTIQNDIFKTDPTNPLAVNSTERGSSVDFDGLKAGKYFYTIKDLAGTVCVTDFDFTLEKETIVEVTSESVNENVTCFGEFSGSVTLGAAGTTTGSYFYEFTHDGNTVSGEFTPGAPITGIPATDNDYLVIKIDENDLFTCPDTVMVRLQHLFPQITYSINKTNVSECNGTDGTITLANVLGGNGAKQSRLMRIASPDPVVIQDFDDLGVVFPTVGAGSYFVEIRDENGCIVSSEDSPTVISAPGAVEFQVNKVADADCINNGKSGVISIQFNTAGDYLIGIGKSQVVEPEVYVDYKHNDGDPLLFVDTLSRGNYFVFVKPATGTACPSTRPTGEIEGAYAISFEVQRVCPATAQPSINLINVIGQPNAQMTIEVYRLSNLSEMVDQFTVTTTDIISITYQGAPAGSPHTWLIQPDTYVIKGYQNQSFCPGEPTTPSYQVTYTSTQPMTLAIENIKQSLPEPRHTGGFTLKTVIGGSPLQDEDARSYFIVNVLDPSSNTPIMEEINVYRNAQGNYQHDFRNLPVGNYLVEVIDNNGCEATTIVIVPADTRILIPNIFTPNNDTMNDQFEIVNLPEGGSHKLVITNRWGKQVFSSGNYSEGNFWDAEGEPDGIYFYRLQVQGDQTYTGWVEVLRGDKP